MILAVGGKEPRVASGAFVATSAVLIGEVTLEDGASVWYQAVLDGGQGPVRIGRQTNVQDGALLTGTAEAPLEVAARVSIGHGAILSGCRIEEGALIAIRSAVLEGATVGADAIVGAGAVVPPGGAVPARTVVLGNPATVRRALTEEEIAENRRRVERYAALARSYRSGPEPSGGPAPR
ncbi:MAG: gamma carbonic anhydrase family protein [candidate division NC10 bacterium]|nr:gamma carbonic anhydrase family protein [candidate division NC10 bacterium]